MGESESAVLAFARAVLHRVAGGKPQRTLASGTLWRSIANGGDFVHDPAGHDRLTLGRDSKLARSLGSDLKGRISIAMYVAAIGFAWLHPTISDLLYIGVALLWVIPDRRAQAAIDD